MISRLRRRDTHGAWAWVAGLAAAAGVIGCETSQPTGEDPDPPGAEPAVGLTRIVGGLESPVDLQAPAGDPRSFVVEQPGRIRLLRDDSLLDVPFLDITDRVGFGGERGLLGLAFPPDYDQSGRFYVHYTDVAGRTTVSRFGTSADPDLADPGSEEVFLDLAQPFSNHNGGQIAFGPDGMLYVALGDGGSANDPLGSGQDTSTLLGSLLRLDVRTGPPYSVPPGNPFVGDPGGRDEIWAYGLRNPWRFSWDSGFLFIGDVGQNRWEEINTAPEGFPGRNFGWSRLEGNSCFQTNCSIGSSTLPTLTYDHSEGCSVTGGYVYRGEDVPALQGRYVYGDYCAGWVRTFRLVGLEVEDEQELLIPRIENLTSFGRDGHGELYVLSQNGNVFRFVSGA